MLAGVASLDRAVEQRRAGAGVRGRAQLRGEYVMVRKSGDERVQGRADRRAALRTCCARSPSPPRSTNDIETHRRHAADSSRTALVRRCRPSWLTHASEWFASHGSPTSARTRCSSGRARCVHATAIGSIGVPIVSALACRGADVRPVLERVAVDRRAVSGRRADARPRLAPGAGARGLRAPVRRESGHAAHTLLGDDGRRRLQPTATAMVRAIADRLVASGEPLTAMHYDKLLSAAVWSQKH
jgi:hypothetical protein